MTKQEDPQMQVVKTATCKSITGKSTLTYQIGCTPDNTVHIRISKNTGAGFFNPEWIKIEDIQKALVKGREGDPLTSFLLEPLLRGRSSNTPAFILAALTQEKLLRVLKGKKRGHEFLLDPEDFSARMNRLVSSPAKTGRKTTGGSNKGTPRSTTKKAPVKRASTKKAAIKKRAVARRKQ